METKRTSMEALQNIVGVENVRDAAPEDATCGVEPLFVVEPGSVEETSELMKLADREGLVVAPRGGGTKMHLGDPPREIDLILSTARLVEVIEYVPGDQVVRVQSGIRLADLQERLAGSNQMLGIDPPEEGATIGGIVASNSSGPRRYRYGTIRDLIIGITVVLSDGTVAKAGGKVVKNVAGYDLSKLFTGSLGTLGVIAEANFRLHPRPEVSRTVAVAVESSRAAQGAAQAIVHSQVEATAVELRWDEEQKQVTVLLESIPAGIEAKAETAAFLLKDFGEVRELSEDEGDLPAPPEVADDEAVVKVSVPPNELASVLDSVLGAAGRRDVGARLTGHAASGVTYATLSGGTEARAAVVEELREIRSRRGGSVVLLKAPLELKKMVGTWQTSGRDDLGLMRRVKEKFDPRGGLNPGRFIGGF
ncbi:MAG TPA: FAD-binding oxidoreductase [Rubrobacteraceae bacterium]|nr:FAD-binding oxidoreductase [Rubrobacteraceae bacterium]